MSFDKILDLTAGSGVYFISIIYLVYSETQAAVVVHPVFQRVRFVNGGALCLTPKHIRFSQKKIDAQSDVNNVEAY